MMKYSIDKIENGSLHKLHKDICSRNEAKILLNAIANENIKRGFIVTPRPSLDNPCSVVINNGEIVYIIGE